VQIIIAFLPDEKISLRLSETDLRPDTIRGLSDPNTRSPLSVSRASDNRKAVESFFEDAAVSGLVAERLVEEENKYNLLVDSLATSEMT